jgi:hypothetical protein
MTGAKSVKVDEVNDPMTICPHLTRARPTSTVIMRSVGWFDAVAGGSQ